MNRLHYVCVLIFLVFSNVNAQEIVLPRVESPENTFYAFLEHEKISDPEKFNGKPKKVVKTSRQFDEDVNPIVISVKTMYLNTDKMLTKTNERLFWDGVEESMVETDHLKKTDFTIEKKGNKTIKIKQNKVVGNVDYSNEFLNGKEYYIYEKDRLITFYNANDSVSYTYNANKKLTGIRYMESLLLESHNDQDESVTFWRTEFQDKVIENVTYKNGKPIEKKVYSIFDEIINVETNVYTYNANNQLKKYQTTYRYYYDERTSENTPFNALDYSKLKKAEPDNVQTGTFSYDASNRLKTYEMTTADEKKSYEISYDPAGHLHLVKGVSQTFIDDKSKKHFLEYEYSYGAKGNPKNIRYYTYDSGEKMLEEEITFEIEYYKN